MMMGGGQNTKKTHTKESLNLHSKEFNLKENLWLLRAF